MVAKSTKAVQATSLFQLNNLGAFANPKLLIGVGVWSVLVFAGAYSLGSFNEKKAFADKNKPLTAPVTGKQAALDLQKASSLAQAQQYDQAIAILTPQVGDAKYNKVERVQGMNLLGQYHQAKTDPETAVKWYNEANKLAGSPQLQATLGAASASAQLYAFKSAGSAGLAGAASYKSAAIEYYTQALSLTADATLKTQISTQIASLSKAR